jgi:hypothetical protein
MTLQHYVKTGCNTLPTCHCAHEYVIRSIAMKYLRAVYRVEEFFMLSCYATQAL